MFYIEIERANGTKFAHTIDDEVLRFDTAEEADELAEAMWLRLGEFGNYARFSVNVGKKIEQLNCTKAKN